MDQRTMYEAQSDPAKAACGIDFALKGRDDFVIAHINRFATAKGLMTFNVAELSIGDGRLTKNLLLSNRALSLTCADISSVRGKLVGDMLTSLNLSERAKFVECNFDIDFDLMESDSYEVVVALDVMEHVFDVFNFVNHCRRILKEQGILILRVPNVAYIKHRFNLLRGCLPATASWFGKPGDLTEWKNFWGWDGGHLHLFTLPILKDLLQGYGFRVEQCRDAGTRLENVRNLWPNLLYANPVIIATKQL